MLPASEQQRAGAVIVDPREGRKWAGHGAGRGRARRRPAGAELAASAGTGSGRARGRDAAGGGGAGGGVFARGAAPVRRWRRLLLWTPRRGS